MVKNWDFGANYWGDGGQILGGCLGNNGGMGVKYWEDVSPHPPGFAALTVD